MAKKKRVHTPVIAPPGGDYPSPPVIVMSCATPGAEIRYTTDGSTPNKNSTLYTEPFPLEAPGDDS